MSKISPYHLKINHIKAEMHRGRGNGSVFSHPIELEPPFSKFSHKTEKPKSSLWNLFKKSSPNNQVQYKRIEAPTNLGFIAINISTEGKLNLAQFEQFLLSLKLTYPLGFEIIGSRDKITFQLVAQQTDLPLITNILQTHFPDAEAVEQVDFLREALANIQPVISAYCLKDSHCFPLKTDFKLDPYHVLLSNLNSITQGMAAFQILFMPVKNNWAENMISACRDEFDPTKSVFADLPQLPKLVSEKINKPLFAVSIRIIASSQNLSAQVESILSQYGDEHNGLVKLDGDYPLTSLLARTNHAPGILLNSKELVGLVHLPDPEISIPKLAKAEKTAPAPLLARSNTGISLGNNTYQGKVNPVSISFEWATRHVAIFGGTGAGKTNFLGHLFGQFIEKSGCAFLDPNGDASLEFLSLIPKDCIDRVIYFDPIKNPLAINPLAIKHPSQIEITTVNLLTALKRLFDASSWGPRLEYILRKSIKTLLLAGNKTLLDIPPLLTDKNYRTQVLPGINDPELLNFWKNSFPKFGLNALLPILNKLSVLLDSDIIKPIISNPKPDIDFEDVLNNQKIFIANLSKGTLGEKNAHILGSFIQSSFQMAVMARASIPIAERKPFILIIDEFHNYAGSANVDSINSLLSEARKYKVSLITATQFLSQVDKRIKDAIFGNVGTLICLRVGIDDSQVLQKELGQFIAEDLLNLKVGEAIVRMGTAKDSFNLQIPLLEKPTNDYSQEILRLSQHRKAAFSSSIPSSQTVASAVVPPSIPSSSSSTLPTTPPMTNLLPDERKLLEFLYQTTEILSLNEIRQKIGWGNKKLYRLANDLLQKNLIAETQLNLSSKGRSTKIVMINQNGINTLGLPFLAGKGGALHQYLQRIIKSFSEKRGYQVAIEQPIGQQQAVDVSLEKDGKKTAIEISITTDATQELANIQKCLAAGYERIIVLCLDNQKRNNLKKRVNQSIKVDLQGKIFLPLLSDLFPLI